VRRASPEILAQGPCGRTPLGACSGVGAGWCWTKRTRSAGLRRLFDAETRAERESYSSHQAIEASPIESVFVTLVKPLPPEVATNTSVHPWFG